MNELTEIFATLKQVLKQQNLTYKALAAKLEMSEANVKRMFSQQQCTLSRLEEICHIAGLRLSDLFVLVENNKHKLVNLTEEQEKELIANPKLFLAAACLRDGWSYEDIIKSYDIDEFECIRLMARLDKLKIIQLLPNNQYKMLISQDFHWIPNGPLERFMAQNGIPQFLNGNFLGDDSAKIYIRGTFSPASIDIIKTKLQLLKKEAALLNQEDTQLPISKRQHVGILLALRPWELPLFKSLRRVN